MTKATVQQSDFRHIARSFAGLIERRNTIPILSCVKLEISAGKLTASGTDLDVELCLETEAETEGKRAFMVDFQMLRGFASACNGPVTLSIREPEKAGAPDILKIGDSDMTMRVNLHLPVEDYPGMDARFETDEWRTTSVAWSMSQKEADRIIGAVQHCISTEETRYYLNGIHLTTMPDGNALRAVATDGHRMGVADTDIQVPDFTFTWQEVFKGSKKTISRKGIILPSKTARIVRAHLKPAGNEPAGFRFSRAFGRVTLRGLDLRCRVIDGAYPDYTRVIPKEVGELTAHLSLDGLRRMHAAAKCFGQRAIHCKLDCRNGKMVARGPEADQTIELPMQGKATNGKDAFGFNLNYLHAQARCTPAFSISGKDQASPALIRSQDPDAFWVLMPVRL